MVVCRNRREAGDRELRDHIGDALGRIGTVGTEPVDGPVDGAEEGAGGDAGVGSPQRAGADAVGDQRPHAALVAIALADDCRAQAAGQGVELEVRRRSLELVEQAQNVRRGEAAQADRQRIGGAPRFGEGGVQPIQGPILAEVEQFVLAAEVVIEVARREIGGDRDVAHAGGGKAALAEDPRRGPEDLHPAGVGAA